MNNEKLYNTIKTRFRNYPDIKIEKARFEYGYYFDGIKDNYTEIPGVWIEYRKPIEEYVTPGEYRYNSEKIYSVLGKLKNIRFENHSIKSAIFYRIYDIDYYEKAQKAAYKGNVFQNAFWQEIHRQDAQGEKRNQNLALAAGEAAISKIDV